MQRKFSFRQFIASHKKAKRSKLRQLWPKILLWSFVLFVVGFISAGSFVLFVFKTVSQDLPNPAQLSQRQMAQSTKIYDRTGENLLYEIHGEEKRTLIKIDELPEFILQATISAEDKDFYNHQGINFRGLLRAVYKDIFYGKFEGGSSITQQLITNTLLTRGTTTWQKIQRKFREWILAYQIEQKFNKKEILQMYINEIPYGSNAYGIESAAKTFFGKSAKDATLAQAALLVSLPNKPSRYSPYGEHQDEMFARQQWVLRQMKEQNYITDNQYQEALKEKIVFRPKAAILQAPHFVMYVKNLLEQKYGEDTLEQGGLKIITTLDLTKQQLAEKIIQEKTADYPKKFQANNAALLALDPKTGQILAMVGSRDYYNNDIDGQFNVVTSPRQPGSSFKPIVYAAAFQKGYTPDTVLFDVNTTFKNYPKDYNPHNYDGKEHGPVTIRKALAGSLNIPAVKTLYLTGIDRVLDFAKSLGYTTFEDRSRFGLSLVLGGGEIKLIDHLNAYSTFANDGIGKPTTPILKIENAQGKILEEFKLQETKKMEPQIARLINDILSDNAARAYIFGINNYLHLANRPIAAKSGTTNDFHDAWTMGYTPSLAAGVWVGNNDFTSMKRKSDGGLIASPLWQEFMKQALEGTKVEEFIKPEPIVSEKPILRGEYKIPYMAKIDRLSGKLATELTPPDYIEEKTFYGFHNILYYLNKDDPTGEGNSQDDEQYANWESAVQRFVTEQQKQPTIDNEPNPYIIETPPVDFDQTHTLVDRPTIGFDSPQANSTIIDPNFKALIYYTTVNNSEPEKIKYYLDDKLIKLVSQQPFNQFDFQFSQITNGFHSLKAEIYDQSGNFNSAIINLNFLFPNQPLTIQWLGPIAQSSFAANLEISLNIQVSDYTQMQKVEFYVDNQLITTLNSFTSNNLSTTWQTTSAGWHTLQAKVYNKQGDVFISEQVPVEIK